MDWNTPISLSNPNSSEDPFVQHAFRIFSEKTLLEQSVYKKTE